MHPPLEDVSINSKGAILIASEFAADGPCTERTLFVSHAHSDHIGGLRRKGGGRDAVHTSYIRLSMLYTRLQAKRGAYSRV